MGVDNLPNAMRAALQKAEKLTTSDVEAWVRPDSNQEEGIVLYKKTVFHVSLKQEPEKIEEQILDFIARYTDESDKP